MQEADESAASIAELAKHRHFVGSVVQQIDARLAKSGGPVAPLLRHCLRSILPLLGLLRKPSRIYEYLLRPYPRALYRGWIAKYEAFTPDLRSAMEADLQEWPYQPLISVILYNEVVQPNWTNETLRSVTNQIYPNWELCICGDPATVSKVRNMGPVADPRVRTSISAGNGDGGIDQNRALELTKGDYVAFLSCADLLSEDSLFWIAREIVRHSEVDLLFSDEDRVDIKGGRLDPWFKPAWNQALMLSQAAFGQLGVFRREVVERAGGLRSGYGDAQHHDLVLRCCEKTTCEKIRHIPRVLYHRRARSSGTDNAPSRLPPASNGLRQAISDHLERVGVRAVVSKMAGVGCQVQYEVPQPQPFVSIIVPSTLRTAVTAKCLISVLSKSTYQEFELLVLGRSNNIRAATDSSEFAKILADPRVRIVQYEDPLFNFSRVCNLGRSCATGSILCFLNDDVEVITVDWLERLVSRVVLDGVGAVGPMLYYPNNTIQHAGVVLGIGGVAAHAFSGIPRGYHGYFGRACTEQDYSCVTGACVVIRREVFDAAGGFDETLPIAFNDVDLCLKIRRKGARIIWTPSVEMYHHESMTFGAHDSLDRLRSFMSDVEAMRHRWGGTLGSDSCYNPNLATSGPMFSLALPPRMPLPEQILSRRESISRTSELR